MLGGDAGGRIESATRASWEVRKTDERDAQVVEENRSTLALTELSRARKIVVWFVWAFGLD